MITLFKRCKNGCLLAVLFCALSFPLFAEKTRIAGLYQYTLDNGLELFVAENHAAPLVYIKLSVKAGGIAQTPETAGVFHLYEHMMFEGDSQYPDGAAMDRGIKDLGVTYHNASTGSECVNYFFTVPSNLLEKGLAFWNYAIREPLLRPDELEAQKKVVISEIEGHFSDPEHIGYYNMTRTMFPKFPWRLDPGGTTERVQNATVDGLKQMLKKYYVPNNAALFVGGDVSPSDVYEKVKQIYGTWQRAPDPWAVPNEVQLAVPFTETQYRVMPNDKVGKQVAMINVLYRGPDSGSDTESLSTATVFDTLLADPDGFFKKTMLGVKELQIPDANYVSEGCSLARESGLINFSAGVFSPEKDLPARVKLFADTISGKFIPAVLADRNIFTAEQFATVHQSVKDSAVIRTETAAGLVDEMEFWWVHASADYYFKYLDNLAKVAKPQIDAYLNRYLAGKKALVIVYVNPELYEQQKQAFAAAGFIEFTKESAYWWSKPGAEASK